MDSRTGAIFRDINDMPAERLDNLSDRLVPLTERQYEAVKPMSRSERKGYMRNQPCPCGSGKKFKRCHWSDPGVLFNG